MPLYEFQCRSCGTVSEYLVGVGRDQPDLSCTSCGSDELQQMISLVSVSRHTPPHACCGGAGNACEGGGCDSGGTCSCEA